MLSTLWASAAIDNPPSVSALLDRVAGTGAGSQIETTVDDTYVSGTGAEMFQISSKNGKPWIKGTTLSAVTTGLGWYLNHTVGINLCWNFPTTTITNFPLPQGTEEHATSAQYRYYLNYCTFSYSMSTWTWERWQQEIDWMALRGVNMPLQIIGLEEVWRKFLMEDYNYSKDDANAFVGGPSFMAWFGMNNLEGWGGPNPDWWYTRQAQLGQKINERMRSLGIEPVLPGFAGMVPSNFSEKTGVAAASQGGWCGFQRPYIVDSTGDQFSEVAANYYKRLKEVMGESKYYSIDPYHEGGKAPDNPGLGYQKMNEALHIAKADAQWVIQSWQWSGAQRSCLNNIPKGQLIVLDLYSDGNPNYRSYSGHETVYSTIFNFGGRTGFFGRVQKIIDGYFDARTVASVKGIGAAPEAIEQTPIMYDLLFELPWLDSKPDAQQWVAEYAKRRYQADNADARQAWELLRTSALDCQSNLQGPHEAVMCGRPSLTINSVSTWGGSGIFYDQNKTATAAYKLLNSNLSGNNYDYDLVDIVRQAVTDYSKSLLGEMNRANSTGNTQRFNELKEAFLGLMLDVDELLCTHSDFMLGHWTERARKMADEVPGTTAADRDWLEFNNARTLITTWGPAGPAGSLRDYSYRQWGGMVKDFYYARWKKWFDSGMKGQNWFNWEWNWAHSNPDAYNAIAVGNTREVASRILPKYLSQFNSAIEGIEPYYVPRMMSTDASAKVHDKASRDNAYRPSFITAGTQIAEIAIDFNKSNIYEDYEKSAASDGSFVIPADAPVGERKCRITLDDGTVFVYTLRIVEEITEPRTVTVKTSDPERGSVAIEGTTELSVTNTDVVKITATPTQKYDFEYWSDAEGNNVGNDNPLNYYGKESAEFTAHFIPNKWGVPSFSGTSFPPGDMISYGQYLISLGITQGGEDKVFFESDTPPTEHFHYVTNRIKAAPGGTFHFNYQGKGNMQYQFLSAYCDLNSDGIFDINSPELLGTKGTYWSTNASVGQGGFNVMIPYDTPLGTTHIRLRFDGAWMDKEVPGSWVNPPGAFKPDVPTNRIIYEVLLELNEGVDYASTVTVKSGNEQLGTVRTENSTNVYLPGETVILTAFPTPGTELSHWEDSHGRKLPEKWMDGNTIRFTAFDNADITAVFRRTPIEIDHWTFAVDLDEDNDYCISGLIQAGEPDLDLSYSHSGIDYIKSIKPEVFAGNLQLRTLVLPDQQLVKKGDRINDAGTIAGNGTQIITPLKDKAGNNYTMNNTPVNFSKPFMIKITGHNTGKTYNQWGSVLFANGTNGFADDYSNGWNQVYLKKNGQIDVKWDSGTAVNFPISTLGDFKIIIEYLGNKQTKITVSNADGKSITKTLTNTADMKAISQFATAIPEGMSIKVAFTEPDVPQIPGEILAGCRNLMDIHLSSDNQYAVEKNGVVYDKTGVNCIAYPEGRILGGAFSLKTGTEALELTAAPTKEGNTFSNLGITTTAQTTNWNTLWTIDSDGSLIHYNSGLGVDADGTALSADDAQFAYAMVYDEGEPSIMFTDPNNHYLTPTGMNADKFTFDFYALSALTVPGSGIRTAAFPVNVIVPEDAEVYSLDKVGTKGGYISHIMPGHIIPAGTGVLIDGAAKPFEITSQQSVETPDMLDGTTVDLVLNSPYYVLEGEYFVRHASGTVAANTGYVPAGLLDVAQFRYQPEDYRPVEIDGWKFDWRYSYSENVICLTSALEAGNPELDLSDPIEGTGDRVVDIDPAMFANHPGLVGITLPASRLAHHYYDSSLQGAGTNNHTLVLPQPLSGNTPWQMTMELTSNGNGFNNWGSGLFATGTNATADSYSGGFQLYLQKFSNNGGHIILKRNSQQSTFDQVPINTQDINADNIQHFAIAFNYSKNAAGNYALTVIVSCKGKSQSITVNNYKLNRIESFCASIPVGVNIEKLHLEGEEIFFPYNEGTLFAGCMNLQNIHVASGADYAVEHEGVLYDINNQNNCIAYPEGRLFTRPFVLTTESDVNIGANPILVNNELTETAVTPAATHTQLNSLWKLGADKHLTHINSGAHLNAVGTNISVNHGEFAHKLIYGNGEPSLQFSLNEESHLGLFDNEIGVGTEAHLFRFKPMTSLQTPVETGKPHVITFPVAVIVGDKAVVKGVESIDEKGANLFTIAPGTIVPAGHAMITYGGTADFEIADATTRKMAADINANLLRGTTSALNLNVPYYELAGLQFVRHSSGVVPANSAYILAPENMEADQFPYDVTDGEATEITAVSDFNNADNVTFDLQGRRVRGTLRPGFYIRNGHKIFIR